MECNVMRAKRAKVGDIIEIHVHKEYYCYAQKLQHGETVFFDYKSEYPLNDYSVLDSCKPLFFVAIYDYILKKGIWHIVANHPVRDTFKDIRMYYIYHKFENTYELYNSETGDITPASREMCRGLECCAVWGDNHVEDRIYDYYAGHPCIWMKEHDELWKE